MNEGIRRKLISKIKNDANGRAQYVFEYIIERTIIVRFYWKWENTITVFINEAEQHDIKVTENDGTRPTVTRVYDTVTEYIENNLIGGQQS